MRKQLTCDEQLKGQVLEKVETINGIVFLLLADEAFAVIVAEHEYDGDLISYITFDSPFDFLADWELPKLVEWNVISQEELENHQARVAVRRQAFSVSDLRRRAELLGFRLEKYTPDERG